MTTTLRDHPFGLAYRMLGSVQDAEDVVQEARLRLARTEESIDDPGAWLTTVATNLCIDHLRSARVRREEYVGPWLPEPLVDLSPPADEAVIEAESLSLAFLVVLEALSPDERAVFLLHDIFGHPHADIAQMLDRSEASVRKLASRARKAVEARRPRQPPTPWAGQDLAAAFLAACAGGDLGEVMALLAPEVSWVSDGGGLASAATRPVVGAERVARFAVGLARSAGADVVPQFLTVNGEPGILLRSGRGIEVVLAFEVDADGLVTTIRAMRNPDKLRHLDP